MENGKLNNSENNSPLSTFNFPLSTFITEHREKRGMSQSGLAKRAAVSLSEIEEIESGQLLFLSTILRQKIARALKLTPAEIKLYEKNLDIITAPDEEYIDELRHKILNNDTKNLRCPVCGSNFITKVEKMYDPDDNLILHPKAHCAKCPFQVK